MKQSVQLGSGLFKSSKKNFTRIEIICQLIHWIFQRRRDQVIEKTNLKPSAIYLCRTRRIGSHAANYSTVNIYVLLFYSKTMSGKQSTVSLLIECVKLVCSTTNCKRIYV